MRHTAVIKLIGYFRKGVVSTNHHLLGAFDFLEDDKIFDSGIGNLGKQIR